MNNTPNKQEEIEKEIEEYIVDCMNYGYSRKRITDDLLTVKGLREFGDEDDALEIVRKQAEIKGIKETKQKIINLFKEDSIYTGAVIKYEINSKI
jgi:hypothetical protein